MTFTCSFLRIAKSLVSGALLLSCVSLIACGASSQPGDQDAEVRDVSIVGQQDGAGVTVELRFQPDSIDLGVPTYTSPDIYPSIPVSLGASVTVRYTGGLEYIEGSSSVNGMPLGDPARFTCESGATLLTYYIGAETAAPLQTSSLLLSFSEQGVGSSSVEVSVDPFFGCDSDSEEADTLMIPGAVG